MNEICGQILKVKICRELSEFGLTQNYTPELKVEIRFYVDSENFMKNIETLLSYIVLNEINCVNQNTAT